MVSDPWSLVAAAASAIAEHTGIEQHEVAVVLGSGWAEAAECIGTTVAEVPMGEVPGFAPPSVAGRPPCARRCGPAATACS
jgi:purine-nucleoside phosphorylase